MRVGIVIVCHIALFRAMLSSVCGTAGFPVLQACESVDDIDTFENCNVIVLHVAKDSRGVERDVVQLRSQSPSVPIALIAPDAMAGRLQSELGAMVAAIIPESVTALDLFTSSLKMVANGYRLMPGHAATTGNRYDDAGPRRTTATAPIKTDLLSKREVAIMSRLCDGLPNKTIATELGISEGTVKVHLRTIFRKTGVNNRTQAALWGTGRR